MGYYKRLLENTNGMPDSWQLKGYDVGARCFDDPNLQAYIEQNGELDICPYSGEVDYLMPLDKIVEYIYIRIHQYYNHPDNCDLYLASSFEIGEDDPDYKRVGPYFIPRDAEYYGSTRDLLEEIGAYSSQYEDINEKLIEFIGDHDWILKEPFIITVGEELSLKWREFAEKVKYSRRFTFLAEKEFNAEPPLSDNCLGDILSEISGMCHTEQLVHTIEPMISLFRARELGDKPVDHSFKEITSTPCKLAAQNRMSPQGISMFYGAFDMINAVVEGSPNRDGKGLFLVGEFTPKRPLRVLDLTRIPDHITFWLGDFEKWGFLKSFSHELSLPTPKDDKNHIEYVPSQVVTEYLRYMYEDKEGKLDGIIYRSAIGYWKNVVLFCDNKTSVDWLSLKNINEIKRDFSV